MAARLNVGRYAVTGTVNARYHRKNVSERLGYGL